MTPASETAAECAFQEWWMSDAVPPDAKYKDEPGGPEDQMRAAFMKGWQVQAEEKVELLVLLEVGLPLLEEVRLPVGNQPLRDLYAKFLNDAQTAVRKGGAP